MYHSYKQNKFNLFREDNVGYAALTNDLIVGSTDHEYDKHNQAPPTPLDRVPTFLQTISSHIGKQVCNNQQSLLDAHCVFCFIRHLSP